MVQKMITPLLDLLMTKTTQLRRKKTSTSTVTPTNASTSSSPPLKMPKTSKMLTYFQNIEAKINKLHALLDVQLPPIRTAFTNCEVKLNIDYLHTLFKAIQKNFLEDVQEMMNVFYSMESELDETLKQNEILKDRLIEATLADDVQSLVMHSYVEIENKNSRDESERFSKELKDVSNAIKTIDSFCNDAFDVKEELSKRIVQFEKDFSKLEA
ncbi:hypothetical protein Tco_1548542 [Tanacetum coccineum]